MWSVRGLQEPEMKHFSVTLKPALCCYQTGLSYFPFGKKNKEQRSWRINKHLSAFMSEHNLQFLYLLFASCDTSHGAREGPQERTSGSVLHCVRNKFVALTFIGQICHILDLSHFAKLKFFSFPLSELCFYLFSFFSPLLFKFLLFVPCLVCLFVFCLLCICHSLHRWYLA